MFSIPQVSLFVRFHRIVSDRQVILSVNGDGIAVALEVAQILDKIYSTHNWRPRRSLTFCVSLVSSDVCPQTLPIFMQQKIVAYVALHGRFSQGLFAFPQFLYCGDRHVKELFSLSQIAVTWLCLDRT